MARTADPNATPGDNVAAVYVNGELVQPDDEIRVGTFSFLATGGDNFRVFTEGADPRDSGLVDREAWIAYLQASSPLSPDFARQRAVAPELPGSVVAGEQVAFELQGLDLTSLGSPQNTSVSVALVPAAEPDAEGVALGDFPVTDGAASVAATVPAGTAAGAYTLRAVADPSGTTALLPLEVTAPAPQEPAYPEFERWRIYTAGDRVTYRDRVYEALWWTVLLPPTGSPVGVWAEVGDEVETPRGTYSEWTRSWVYTGGETVVHEGHLWRAKWWTRGQEPGAGRWSPWQDLGAY